ncbi:MULTISPECIES: hypothetical protein [Streptomyces]|uniref:hypothetical protein n=1 Tax=Streptomyces herbicida TaxID=3065675 RepID=UPI00292E64CB|nr:hypothetical protein [Streptomyces sp. NEAU-HV9]
MSVLTPGILHARPGRRRATRDTRAARRRVVLVLLVVGLDAAAVVMLLSRQLPNALAGVLLATLGWLTAGRTATRYPARTRGPGEEPVRR